MNKVILKIGGMSCASCSSSIESVLKQESGIIKANVNLTTEQLSIEYNQSFDLNKTIKLIEQMGYTAQELKGNHFSKSDIVKTKEIGNLRKRLIWSAIFALPLLIIAMTPMVLTLFKVPLPDLLNPMFYAKELVAVQLLLTIPIILINYKYYTKGFSAFISNHPNMDSLIAIGTSTAFLYGFYAVYQIFNGNYDYDIYFESIGIILTLITMGKYLEIKTKGRTNESIQKLMDLAPKKATVLRNNKEVIIAIDDIKINDLIVVKPGEKFSVDGLIIEGTTYVDESMLTGEPIPVMKKIKDTVIGGSINKNGYVVYRAIKTINNSTLAEIIKLVSAAQNEKAPIAKLADTISGYFVPTVIVIALLTATTWYLTGESLTFALMIFISILIIACPCALGLATPTAIMVSTGKGAEQGILIKNGETLELTHKVDTVVFDKTGTLTYGKPLVTDVHPFNNYQPDHLITLVASLEKKSEHPLGEAIVNYANQHNYKFKNVASFNVDPGFGISGVINKQKIIVGNEKYLQKNKIILKEITSQIEELSKQGKTVVIAAVDNQVIGLIAIRDEIKKDSKATVKKLQQMHIDVVMLTGDNQDTANAIAKELGIKSVIANVLPQEKYLKIKELKSQGKIVAMVGDGINDAVALVEAHVGIAIGSGTDIAIESANIVLMKDNLMNVPNAIKIGKKTINNIKQNLFWAFIYNIVGIFIAGGILYLFGGSLLNPIFAGLAMAMSSVSVLTNTLRLKNIKF